MTHDPKLVDDLLTKIDKADNANLHLDFVGWFDEGWFDEIVKAREALRPSTPKSRETMTVEDALVVMCRLMDNGLTNTSHYAKQKMAREILQGHERSLLLKSQQPEPPVKSLSDTQTLLANGYYIVQRKTPGEPFYIRTDVENLDRQYIGMIDDHGKFHPNPSPDLKFRNPLTTKAWATK